MKNVAVVGSSVGGLVAAAELRTRGFDVTIFEAGKSIGGMYGKVDTPFGVQELGMHVLYLSAAHYDHLCAIFGVNAFHTWNGPTVDLASHRNFGCNFFDSVYPDLRGHADVKTIRREVLARKSATHRPANALEAVVCRFGEEAGSEVYAPILKKLWKTEADLLTAESIHCFYDLRRVVLWDKEEADRVKADPWFDEVVANPDQRHPHSEVFGGRMAARFKNLTGDFGESVNAWLERTGIRLQLAKPAEIRDGRLWVSGEPLDDQFQACIVATPVPTITPNIRNSMEMLELSIFYFRLKSPLGNAFPAYYMLLHEDHLMSSRIVHYDAYSLEGDAERLPVLSVEVLHPVGLRPSVEKIAAEVTVALPMATISESFVFPSSLKVPIPSIKNGSLIDEATVGMQDRFEKGALYFTGMRTDKGIFFSHHTIGVAHESALDCTRRFACN